jgi:hypothetical protein
MNAFVLEFFIAARFVNLAVSPPQYQFASDTWIRVDARGVEAEFRAKPVADAKASELAVADGAATAAMLLQARSVLRCGILYPL